MHPGRGSVGSNLHCSAACATRQLGVAPRPCWLLPLPPRVGGGLAACPRNPEAAVPRWAQHQDPKAPPPPLGLDHQATLTSHTHPPPPPHLHVHVHPAWPRWLGPKDTDFTGASGVQGPTVPCAGGLPFLGHTPTHRTTVSPAHRCSGEVWWLSTGRSALEPDSWAVQPRGGGRERTPTPEPLLLREALSQPNQTHPQTVAAPVLVADTRWVANRVCHGFAADSHSGIPMGGFVAPWGCPNGYQS